MPAAPRVVAWAIPGGTASAHNPRVNDLARLDRAHLGRIKGHHGNCVTRQGGELDLVARTLPMY
jgi:hypothetical protein